MKANNQSSPSKLPRKINAPDLTAFIDLGFLLVTFFMYSLYLAKPTVVRLNMPEKPVESLLPVCFGTFASATIILGADNRLFWHQQDLNELNANNLHETNYSANGIREIVEEIRKKSISPETFTVIIKPTDASNYKNTVDILDEMAISGINLYAIVDIQKEELIAYENKVGYSNLALK